MTELQKDSFFADLSAVFAANGLSAFDTPENRERFFALTEILLAKNAVMNLTAITDPHEMLVRHYADSLTAAKYLSAGKTVVDVGCGAGFPSLPLAIARPDLRIVGIDSTEKRVVYVNETAHTLGLSNLTALTVRAEDAGAGELRERYDYVTARAVARLNILAEYCLPLLRVGGVFLPMKAKSGAEELAEAKSAFAALCGELRFCEEFFLHDPENPDEKQTRMIAGIEKIGKTEKIYPRNNAQIQKKPL